MNSTLESIYKHKSIRVYKDQPLSTEQRESLLKVLQSMPTSINGQSFSVIIVEDPKKRETLAALSGNQEYVKTCSLFIVFVIDFYRSAQALEMLGNKQIIQESIESVMVGSVDIGIALGSIVVAAESLGLGTVPIGGIRNDPKEVGLLLNLPEYTFPVVGLCIGFPLEEPAVKPRLPREAVIFTDTYKKEDIQKHIEQYDETITLYNKGGRLDGISWSQFIGMFHHKIYYPNVYPVLREKGFLLDK